MSDFERSMMARSFWGLIVAGLIQVLIWTVLIRFLPSGWWIIGINILGFLITAIFIGMGSWQVLKVYMPSSIAFFIALTIWAIIVIGIRSILLNLFGVI